MLRDKVMRQINELLDGRCEECPTLRELNRIHGKSTSHIDRHCHNECEVGRRLRELGRQLNETLRPRRVDEEAEAV